MDRLDTVASLIKKDDILYDIGTDHAYLLLKVYDKIKQGFALDIAEKPLLCAEKTIKENDLYDKISTKLSNGLECVDFSKATKIAICGMGAELIIDILSARYEVKNENISFILQPMTRTYLLRKYLYDSGFSIKTELISREDRRIYTIIEAVYNGEVKNIDETDCFVSESLKSQPLFKDYITYRLEKLRKICRGIKDETNEKYIFNKTVINKLEELLDD